MNIIRAMRLRRLIRAGYFPAELPPPFTTQSFAGEAVGFATTWNGSDIRKHWTAPEHYSIPRYGQMRRKLSIVNPINQLHVSDLIVENWNTIEPRLSRSLISEFKPRIVMFGGRAVTGVDFDGVARRRAKILARYGRYVKTDIARFYPSIYTHSIPWALLGKGWVKQNKNTPQFQTSFANYLDKAIAAGQSGQTIGIPIGPDTSRVLSELVATELESLVRAEVSDLDSRAVRFVDDILIGLNAPETPDVVLSKLSKALYEYELELSGDKTTLHGVGQPHPQEWVHYLRRFELTSKVNNQRDDLDSYFEQALFLSDQNPKESVISFAVKRASSFSIDKSNNDHFVRLLLYAALRSSTCLSFVVEFLASSHASGTALPLSEIVDFISQQLPQRAAAAHTYECSWLLFLARELNLTINSGVISGVTKLNSSVNALLVFDLMQRGLINGALDTTYWQSFAVANGLKSEMWLASYEITKKGWWPTPVANAYVTGSPFFGDLWAKDVSFYDPTRKARPRTGPSFFNMKAKQFANFIAAGGASYP